MPEDVGTAKPGKKTMFYMLLVFKKCKDCTVAMFSLHALSRDFDICCSDRLKICPLNKSTSSLKPI